MIFNHINHFFWKSVFSSYLPSDFRMGSFDIMIECFSNIMEESSHTKKLLMDSKLSSNCFRNNCNFFTMLEHVLTITGTKSEFSNDRNDFIRNPMDIELFEDFLTEFFQKIFSLCFCCLNYFFNTCRLDTSIFDELFQRFFCDISSIEIKS